MSTLVRVHRWIPSALACTRCAARHRYSTTPQPRPHPSCKCTRDSFLGTAFLIAETEIPMLPADQIEVFVGANPNSNSSFEDSIVTTATGTSGWEAGLEVGGFSVGGSGSEGVTVTRGSKQTFAHSGECEGTEAIYSIYDVTEYLIEKLYMVEAGIFNEEVTWIESEKRVEMTWVNFDTRCL